MAKDEKRKMDFVWADRLFITALMTKPQFEDFKKFVRDKTGNVVSFKEVPEKDIFMNSDIVVWKRKYGYDTKFFRRAIKLAKCLGLKAITMPDSKDCLPMAFKCLNHENGEPVYVILSPKTIDGGEVKNFKEVLEYMENKSIEITAHKGKSRGIENLGDIINNGGDYGKGKR